MVGRTTSQIEARRTPRAGHVGPGCATIQNVVDRRCNWRCHVGSALLTIGATLGLSRALGTSFAATRPGGPLMAEHVEETIVDNEIYDVIKATATKLEGLAAYNKYEQNGQAN